MAGSDHRGGGCGSARRRDLPGGSRLHHEASAALEDAQQSALSPRPLPRM